jgi:4-amino-4-deoxy-L-arabinose transferase-like glycosyltransferase
VGVHVTRTADTDALLVLFMSGATVSFYLALEAPQHRGEIGSKWLVLSALALCAAVLTKGVAGLLFLPGMAVFALLDGKLILLLRNRATWASLVLVAVVVFGFYFLRAVSQPGYLAAVQANELAPRYLGVIEGNSGHWNFYFSELLDPWPSELRWPVSGVEYASSAFPWSWLFPLTAAAAVSAPQPAIRQFGIFSVLCIITHLGIISAAATKLLWYPAPVLPFLAIVTGLGAFRVSQALQTSHHHFGPLLGRALRITSIALAIVLALAVAFKNDRLADAAELLPEQEVEVFLRSFLEKNPTVSQLRVLHDGHDSVPAIHGGQIAGTETYHGPEEFYLRAYKGSQSGWLVVSSSYRPQSGDTVIFCRGASHLLQPPSGEVLMHNKECAAVHIP